MRSGKQCVECGAELRTHALAGLCPRCLLKLGEISQFDADEPAAQDAEIDHAAGEILGRYRLIEKIGEGGFGSVWKAEQAEPVQRLVALKVIKLGMDTREVIARFEAERQALAMMDHPGIAKVFDAGATTSGRPYFVMELVEGVPITRYCRERGLDLKARLELFVEVCAAVQHAHQKGIIHRDLKPSNILVGQSADSVQRPAPKVIDFGVAKAIEGRLTQGTLMTRHGQFVGTPVYMSPEQAGAGGMEVDTRSDIYSLGVLLYELLAGVPPFDPKALIRAGFEEMCRIIREQEPLKPSTRLQSSSAAGHGARDQLTGHRALRGDLDWIVMKALEKDRSRRYETVNGFSLDLQRYLNHEPVSAAAPSAAYRLGKFVRRNRSAVCMSAVLSVVLLGGLFGTTWFALREQAQRGALVVKEGALEDAQRAQAAEGAAKKRSDFFRYAHLIELAYQQWKDGNSFRAAELLDQCPAEQRAWEWYFLNNLVYPSPLASFQASPEPVERVFHDPVTQNLNFLTASGHTFARRVTWDPADGWLLQDIEEPAPDWIHTELHQAENSSALEADWQADSATITDGRVTAGGQEGFIELSYVVSRAGVSSPRRVWIRAHVSAVTWLAFNQRGDRLLSAARDGAVILWEVGEEMECGTYSDKGDDETVLSMHPIRQYRATEAEVMHTHFIDADSGFFCTVARDGVLTIWPGARFQTEENSDFPEASIEGGHSSLDFSADGSKLAVLGSGVVCYDFRSGKSVWSTATEPRSYRLQYNKGGDMIAVAGTRTVRTLNAESGATIHEFTQRFVWSLAFDAQGSLVAPSDGGGRGGEVLRWDLAGNPASTALAEHPDGFSSVAISPDGKLLAAARTSYRDGLSHASNRSRAREGGEGKEDESDAVILVWDLEKDELYAELKTRSATIWQLVFSPDGKRLASGAGFYQNTGLGEVKLWDLAARQATLNYPVEETCVFALAFTPDGKRLASAGRPVRFAGENRSMVTLWDLQEGIEVFRLRGDDTTIHELAFSPDGSCLATANASGPVKIWEAPGAGGVNERLATEWKRKQAIPTLNEPRHYVIHPDSEWKWLHPVDGVDPGTRSPDFHQRYSQLDFDDSAWRSGKDSSRPGSGFGYRPRAGERFPGVDIGIPGDGQRYTAYFRRRFTTTEDAEGLELSCQMEDGIIVYLDGVEVVRDNMQEGPDAYRLSAQGAAGSEATKIQRYAIPGTLPAGDHVVAVSLHTVSPNGDFIYLRFAGIALTARKSQPGE